MTRKRLLLCLLPCLLAGIAALHGARGSAPAQLHIATWNLEWLLAPETARQARIACRDAGRATLPCDVALGKARDSADLARLAAHARRLDADVIAFQEVEDAAIAQRVFRGYDICIATGTGVQHVGFAVRRGLAHRCGPEVTGIQGSTRGRAGMSMLLQPVDGPPIELLAVHLKSGCAHDPLDSATAACRLLATQAAGLGQWMQERTSRNAAFVVLGDFNRGGLPDSDDPFWTTLGAAGFIASASELAFGNCTFGAPYSAFIDHILVSPALASRIRPGAFAQLPFDADDAVRYRLSDHCPLGVSLNRARAL